MNELVARIRAGDPPKVPDGRSEEIYLDPALLRCGFGIRVLRTGGAAWYMHIKRKHFGQRKVTLGKVLTLEHVPPGLNREDSPGAVSGGFYRH